MFRTYLYLDRPCYSSKNIPTMPQEIRAMPNSVIHYDHAKTHNSQHYHQGKQIITFRISAKTRQFKFQISNFTANTGVINGSFPKMELGFVPGTNIPAVFLNSKTSDTYVL